MNNTDYQIYHYLRNRWLENNKQPYLLMPHELFLKACLAYQSERLWESLEHLYAAELIVFESPYLTDGFMSWDEITIKEVKNVRT